MTRVGDGASANPFSTCHFGPGALSFDHDGRGDLDGLIDAWSAARRRGEIVGAHGTGKSTLLFELRERLQAKGFEVVFVALHDDDRHLPRRALASFGPRTVLIVDGAEKLARVDRAWLRCLASVGTGLWLSTHDTLGYPVLRCTSSRPELARRLVARVLSRTPELPRLVDPEDVDLALVQSAGNLREAFLLLYDLYERRVVESRAVTVTAPPPIAP